MRAAASVVSSLAPASFGSGARSAAALSDRTLAALGSFCFKAFLLAQFLSVTRLFFSTRLGEGVMAPASLLGVISVVLLLPAVLAYGLRSGSLFGTLVAPAQFWVVGVLGLSGLLFFYGWLGKEYVVTAAAHDLVPYLVILASAILGSIPRVWQDTDRLVLGLFAAGLVINAAGMTEMTNVVSESFAEDRAGVSLVAYRTQGALAFWPLLFLTARLRGVWTVLLAYAGVMFVLAQQILFQKRAPTFRITLFIAAFLFVLPRVAPGPAGPLRERHVLGLFFATAAVGLLVAVLASPWLFEGQVAGLAQRMSGAAYSGGATGMLTWENERFFEAGMFFRTLEPQELILGRGFGGFFIPDTPGWGVWLDDVMEFGRRQLHVGGLMPFFKGGLCLFVTYYAGVVLALVRGVRSLREPFAAAAFFVLAIHVLFLLQEGWFIMNGSFDLVVVGLCLGHLLSRHRTVSRMHGPVISGGRA